MSTESLILELNTETDWDGVSTTTLHRDDATVLGQRYYKFNIAGPHGVVASELGGLFSPVSAKLVGIASSSWNPESRARVIAADTTGPFRQEITLKPEVQHVVVYPGDRLAFLTRGVGRNQIVLSVNEMSEADSVQWALRHGPRMTPTRFRIIREAGAAFVPDLATLWQPTFAYEVTSGLMVARDNGNGRIPTSSLSFYPRFQGCYLSVRYAGHIGDGKLHMVDGLTQRGYLAEVVMNDVRWSRVQYVSHDDCIALQASPAVVGQMMVCDIEVAAASPGNRLSGRYQGGW